MEFTLRLLPFTFLPSGKSPRAPRGLFFWEVGEKEYFRARSTLVRIQGSTAAALLGYVTAGAAKKAGEKTRKMV